tara:strand:- start:827 stop:952 length:126 start_codon:yes stop_codon:yes gene_type:complete
MPKSADIKGVAVVVVGVMAAGLIMYTFRDVGLIANSRSGYN